MDKKLFEAAQNHEKIEKQREKLPVISVCHSITAQSCNISTHINTLSGHSCTL